LTLTLQTCERPGAVADSGDLESRARFDRMVRERQALLRRRARALAGSPHDGDDVLQAALERAWQRFHQFQAGTNELAWLYRILFNTFIDWLRRAESTATAIEQHAQCLPEPTIDDPWASTVGADVQEITAEQFLGAVEQLPEPFKTTYKLHAFQRLSLKAISGRLEEGVSTIGTRLRRARLKLRAILGRARSEEGA